MLTTNSLGIITIHFNRLTIIINQTQRPEEVLQIWNFSFTDHQRICMKTKNDKRITLVFFFFLRKYFVFFKIMCVAFWLYYSAKLLPVMQNSQLENGRAIQN